MFYQTHLITSRPCSSECSCMCFSLQPSELRHLSQERCYAKAQIKRKVWSLRYCIDHCWNDHYIGSIPDIFKEIARYWASGIDPRPAVSPCAVAAPAPLSDRQEFSAPTRPAVRRPQHCRSQWVEAASWSQYNRGAAWPCEDRRPIVARELRQTALEYAVKELLWDMAISKQRGQSGYYLEQKEITKCIPAWLREPDRSESHLQRHQPHLSQLRPDARVRCQQNWNERFYMCFEQEYWAWPTRFGRVNNWFRSSACFQSLICYTDLFCAPTTRSTTKERSVADLRGTLKTISERKHSCFMYSIG